MAVQRTEIKTIPMGECSRDGCHFHLPSVLERHFPRLDPTLGPATIDADLLPGRMVRIVVRGSYPR